MHKRTYKERLKIPIDGSEKISFYSKNGLLLAKGYLRVVIGGRGPYIEFNGYEIVKENIHIPKHAEYKLKQMMPYYWEYRSNDKSFVKIYYQRMQVRYADYKVGKWYISPFDLKTDEFEELLLPLHGDLEKADDLGKADNSKGLFDVKGTLFED